MAPKRKAAAMSKDAKNPRILALFDVDGTRSCTRASHGALPRENIAFAPEKGHVYTAVGIQSR